MSIYYVGADTSWEDYLRDSSPNGVIKDEIRSSSLAERRAISRQTKEIVASRRALVRRFGSGFHSVKSTLEQGFGTLESAIRETQGSIEALRSSFDYHFAIALEQMKLQNQTTMNMLKKLESIHTTLENPLITQARELFRIGCDRLLNGLFDKALDAFLDSALKDETNFLTQLMIGKLYLYGVNKDCNVIDLDKAEQHLRYAARYAKASSDKLEEARRYAGEALLHAAIACYAQINKQIEDGEGTRAQKLIKEAYDLASDSCRVYPELSESHYHRAKFAALIGDGKTSIKSLEKAIEIDDGYCEKAQQDQDFKEVRKEIVDLFEILRKKNEYKLNDKLNRCISFLTEWHYPNLEAKNAKNEMKQLLHEVRASLARKTYFDNRDALHLLREVEDIFQSLLIHKFALHTLSAHVGRVSCLAFNASQDFLASGGADKTINIWRLPENQQAFTLRGHQECITKILFSHDGHALVSVDNAGGIRLWNIEEGTLLKELVGHGSPVHCIAFSPDDSILAAGFYDRQVKLWNMDDYSLLHTLTAHKSSVDTLAFNKSGKFLATGSPDNTTALWHVKLGEQIHTFYGCSGLANSLTFSPDDKFLISGLNDGSVKFYDINSGSVNHELPPRPGAISWLSLSPDCKSLATINHGKALQLWDIENGKLIQNLKPFSPGISSVRFSPDGTILASSDYQDRSMKLWSVHDGRLIHVIAGNLTCSEFSPDGTYYVTGDETGSLKFWGRMIKKNADNDQQKVKISISERIWTKHETNNVHKPEPAIKPTIIKADINEDAIAQYQQLSDSKIDVATDKFEANGDHEAGQNETYDVPETLGKNIWEQVPIPEIAEKPETDLKDDTIQNEYQLHEENEENNEAFNEEQNEENSSDRQQIIEERIRQGKCYVCGKPVGVIAKLAGIKLCYKHSLSI
jgi:WD40 repeat protein